MEILEILNKFDDINKLNLKLKYAKLQKNNFLEVVFNVFSIPEKIIQDKIKDIITNELNKEYILNIKYEIINTSENATKNYIKDFLVRNLIYALSIKIENEKCIIKTPISCKKTIEEQNIEKLLNDYILKELNKSYNYNFIYEEENDVEYSRFLQKQLIQKNIDILKSPKIIEISNLENIYGDINITQTNSIKDIVYKENEIYVCGNISFLNENKTKDTEENGVIKEGKRFLTFSLNDNTGFIKCTVFEKSKNEIIFNTLENSLSVICYGKLRQYNNSYSLTVSKIAKCDFKHKNLPEIIFPEPKYYYTVKPEDYIETSQLSLFDVESETIINDYLKDKSFVVFDFETTGFDAEQDAVTELGAVKIENGKITKTFSTFVNPKMHIPENITQLTHITDEMVKNAPNIEDVVVDFYKFCYNSSIVAHNIDFDFKFLSYNSQKIGINFKNEQLDTLLLARKYIKGLKNYKLGTICEYMHVELIDAHRAVNDCLATAKLFIKLTDYIKE